MIKTDHQTFLDELRRKKQEVEGMIRKRIDDLLTERAAIDDELKELGYSGVPKAVVVHRPRDNPDRQLRSCSVCKAAGLHAESKGHIAKGHDTWLKKQPGHIQAHFKGQGRPQHSDPRLVRNPA